jgi:hypothetical protein
MKDDELKTALKAVQQVKRKNDILLEELKKAQTTYFEYKGKTITVEYKEEGNVPEFLFSAEKTKNQFMITYKLNGIVCFHRDWRTPDWSGSFNMDEMEKALLFGFEKIMFPDCSTRTPENARPIIYEDMVESGLLHTNVETENFWWFMPKDKPYSYIGDWTDSNPILGNVYKIFSAVGNGFGDGAPYIGKFVRGHPCCQTSLAVVYGKEMEGSKEEAFYVLPLHKLDSNDLKNLVTVQIPQRQVLMSQSETPRTHM